MKTKSIQYKSWNFLLFIILLPCSSNLFAQNVAVNTNGALPDASAMLDVQSISKGILIPRMTTIQRSGIATPATGLLVFDITTNSFWFKKTNGWSELAGGKVNIWSKQDTNVYLNNHENAGIGTTTPAVRLQIEHGTDVTNSAGGFLQLGASSLSNLAFDNNEIQSRYNGHSDDISLQANGGNVGIGTKNPEVRLQVSNGTDVSAAGGGYLQLGAASLPDLAFDNNEIQARNNLHASSLYFQHSGGDVLIGASSANTSNVNIGNGRLIKTGTGNSGMMPLCYGIINGDGSVSKATPNVTVTKGGRGTYLIKCPGINIHTVALATLGGPVAYDDTISVAYISKPTDEIDVSVRNITIDAPIDNGFYFIFYNQ